jgi:hypothetical protein
MSEPVKPIVYWLDKNIPMKHRQAVIDGILEWNKAFERIGFKDAIQAKVQPDDADFDTSDTATPPCAGTSPRAGAGHRPDRSPTRAPARSSTPTSS